MPPGGHPARAEALATLSRVVHEKFVDDEVGALLERLRPLEESLEHDSDDASLIRVTRRDWEKQRRVPTELRVEMTRAAALGNQVWIEARATNDFASSFLRCSATSSSSGATSSASSGTTRRTRRFSTTSSRT